MSIKASEKGQALILITLAAVGLFAFAALAIDGSMAFSNKRHAQNAADTAALAGALIYAREGQVDNIEAIALARAQSNGYENIPGDTSTIVTVTVTDVPPEECAGDATGKDITVTIASQMNTTFARVFGRNQIASGAAATSRACGFKLVPLFDGNAIVGLSNTGECGFDTGQGSAEWKVKGGGIYSRGCGNSKYDDSVIFVDPGTCLSLPEGGIVKGTWGCTPKEEEEPLDLDKYLAEIMPPNPCDHTAGDIGIWPDDDWPHDNPSFSFSNGVYCVDDFDDFTKKDITLDNATLYVTDDKFSLGFEGGGGFLGTATKSGTYTGSDDYAGYLVVVEPADVCTKFSDNHHQAIEWRGNGSGAFYGSILAPTACIDLRGNGEAEGMHSQIIGWIVSSNGTADAYVNYEAEENHRIPYHPNISLLE